APPGGNPPENVAFKMPGRCLHGSMIIHAHGCTGRADYFQSHSARTTNTNIRMWTPHTVPANAPCLRAVHDMNRCRCRYISVTVAALRNPNASATITGQGAPWPGGSRCQTVARIGT